MAEVETVKKKGTKKTEEFIMGRGVAKMESAAKLIADSMKEMAELPKQLANLTAEIADKEDQITLLTQQFANRKKELAVQLELDYRADAVALVNDWCQKNGKTLITQVELDTLRNDLDTLKNSVEKEIEKNVAIVTSTLKRHHESEVKIKEAEYKMKEAENTAQISSLNMQIGVLNKELQSWKDQFNDERKASVERSKANAVGNINVGQPSR